MHSVFSFILFAIIWLFPDKAPIDVDITQAVGTSLRSGDASQLSTRFAKSIELVIDAEKVEFSSVQATHAALILRSFFKKYPPQSFQFIYRGASEKMRYSTGTYIAGGQLFSVYVLMRQSGNQQFTINALHFRKE